MCCYSSKWREYILQPKKHHPSLFAFVKSEKAIKTLAAALPEACGIVEVTGTALSKSAVGYREQVGTVGNTTRKTDSLSLDRGG